MLMNMRNELSEKEKIARAMSGIDTDVTFFNVSDKSLDEQIENNKRVKWNEGIQEIEDKVSKYENTIQKAADEYAKDLNGVQIMPTGNYILVKPFTENPFQKVKVNESGIIVDLGGLRPEYKSNESGEYEEAEQMIKVGVIIEVGPECKWLKSGDTVMWYVASEMNVPFYNFGFKVVNETRTICVINDDLNERFKK